MENETSQPDKAGTSAAGNWPGQRERQAEAAERIRRLKSRANRGLITVAVFIAVSILAVQNFSSLAAIPPHIRHTLGSAPSGMMISVALIVYSFSAILTTLSRMTTGSGGYGGLTHIGYLAAFYLFYFFSGGLDENFWAVFAAGMTILGLEAYQIWNWSREEIRREQEDAGTPPL